MLGGEGGGGGTGGAAAIMLGGWVAISTSGTGAVNRVGLISVGDGGVNTSCFFLSVSFDMDRDDRRQMKSRRLAQPVYQCDDHHNMGQDGDKSGPEPGAGRRRRTALLFQRMRTGQVESIRGQLHCHSAASSLAGPLRRKVQRMQAFDDAHSSAQ